jgi:hypothetical protein
MRPKPGVTGKNPRSLSVRCNRQGPSWHVKDAGDFNADGKADILWQNDGGQAAIWLMNGGTPIIESTVGSNLGPTWHATSAAYFNGDGTRHPMAKRQWTGWHLADERAQRRRRRPRWRQPGIIQTWLAAIPARPSM